MIKLPYGNSYIDCQCKDAAVIYSGVKELKSDKEGLVIVREAMANPIGSKSLYEIARGKKDCTIIISDHTRPVPSRDILPPMLEELRRANPEILITLLVATGCHRGTTKEELIHKLGRDIAEYENIAVHDSENPLSNVEIGILPSGAPLIIDRLAAEADLLIAEGFIEPHFFAGFSGGRKSVLPGVCDQVTVLGNHCSSFIDSPYARTGIIDQNPIHIDMMAAVQMAKLAYIVNVIIDEEKNTVAAFAGDPKLAHEAGCEFLRPYCQREPIYGDIVITTNGGYPFDQNVYQCVKSMTAAEACAKEGAVLIICGECRDGVGGESFYQLLKECRDAETLYQEFMETPQQETKPDQWQCQILARILKYHSVIFVTEKELKNVIKDMKMIYASTLEEALAMAMAEKTDPSITIIPDGIGVIIQEQTKG